MCEIIRKRVCVHVFNNLCIHNGPKVGSDLVMRVCSWGYDFKVHSIRKTAKMIETRARISVCVRSLASCYHHASYINISCVCVCVCCVSRHVRTHTSHTHTFAHNACGHKCVHVVFSKHIAQPHRRTAVHSTVRARRRKQNPAPRVRLRPEHLADLHICEYSTACVSEPRSYYIWHGAILICTFIGTTQKPVIMLL